MDLVRLHSRDAALKIRHPLQICHQKQKEQRTGSAALPVAFLHNSKGIHPLTEHNVAITPTNKCSSHVPEKFPIKLFV